MTETQSRSLIYYISLLGILSPFIWTLIVIILGFIFPDYNHLTDFMSTLGSVGAPFGFVQRFNFFQFGITTLLVGVALYKKLEHPSKTALVLMVIQGIGLFLSGIFSENINNPESFENIMHDLVGLPVFLTLYLVPLIAGLKMRGDDNWSDLSRYSIGLSPLMFIALILMFVYESTIIGLFQRFFIGFWYAWIFMISYRLYKLSG